MFPDRFGTSSEHDIERISSVVVVEAGVARGVKADDTQLEALLVTAPSPSDAEHGPVSEGIRRDESDP